MDRSGNSSAPLREHAFGLRCFDLATEISEAVRRPNHWLKVLVLLT
jgi:hypothetical protein